MANMIFCLQQLRQHSALMFASRCISRPVWFACAPRPSWTNRAGDTTRRKHERVRTTQQSTQQGRGRGTCMCVQSPSYKTGRSWRARGSIQGRQETQHDANVTRRRRERECMSKWQEGNNASINTRGQGKGEGRREMSVCTKPRLQNSAHTCTDKCRRWCDMKGTICPKHANSSTKRDNQQT